MYRDKTKEGRDQRRRFDVADCAADDESFEPTLCTVSREQSRYEIQCTCSYELMGTKTRQSFRTQDEILAD